MIAWRIVARKPGAQLTGAKPALVERPSSVIGTVQARPISSRR